MELKEQFLGTGKAVKDQFSAIKEVGSAFASSFSSALQGLTDGTFNLRDALGSLLSSLTNLFSNQAISLLSGGSGGGGIFSGIISKFLGVGQNNIGGVGGLTFEERANGGPVTGGRPYLIGERGPEMFVPDRSGSIIPNRDMRGGGEQKVIINNYNGSDVKASRGSNGSLIVTVRAMVNDTLGGGYADKTMNAKFGVNPRRERR